VTHKPLDPPGQIEKGPIGTYRMEKGSGGDFYDEFASITDE
jgi:hypothetical protein